MSASQSKPVGNLEKKNFIATRPRHWRLSHSPPRQNVVLINLNHCSCWEVNCLNLLLKKINKWVFCVTGGKFGHLVVDCCGCPAVSCDNCQTFTEDEICPRGNDSRPADCYKFKAHDHYTANTSCWLPSCQEKPSDAPPDQVS